MRSNDDFRVKVSGNSLNIYNRTLQCGMNLFDFKQPATVQVRVCALVLQQTSCVFHESLKCHNGLSL